VFGVICIQSEFSNLEGRDKRPSCEDCITCRYIDINSHISRPRLPNFKSLKKTLAQQDDDWLAHWTGRSRLVPSIPHTINGYFIFRLVFFPPTTRWSHFPWHFPYDQGAAARMIQSMINTTPGPSSKYWTQSCAGYHASETSTLLANGRVHILCVSSALI